MFKQINQKKNNKYKNLVQLIKKLTAQTIKKNNLQKHKETTK